MKRIAIVGAGPAGLEAALYARRLGYPVTVYEREEIGANVARWGHVAMFSPWRMNLSAVAAGELAARGWSAPDPEAFPTGREFRERYLLPLAELLGTAVRTGVEVRGISRRGLLKGEGIGGDRRAAHPFRLLLARRSGEEFCEEVEVVIDASGVFGNPNPLGDGGLPSPGERAAEEAIDRGLPEVLGADRPRYAGKKVLLVGAGHSAATSLVLLSRLAAGEPGTRICWSYRRDTDRPLPEIDGDPLPARSALAREANRLAREKSDRRLVFPGTTVEAISRIGTVLRVLLRRPNGESAGIEVDRILSNTGFRPDLAISRELQAHHCYASEGPMRLAAKLLGAGSDCLKMPSPGPDAQRHPEPNFFTAGHKSYGRSTSFLLANGRQGIRDLFRLVTGDAELDLEAEAR